MNGSTPLYNLLSLPDRARPRGPELALWSLWGPCFTTALSMLRPWSGLPLLIPKL